ncbi:hypothetical protein LV78_003374 [Actinosynnema pretiosum]|nr:hypothetical protein [Actinosynnema pretiosum]
MPGAQQATTHLPRSGQVTQSATGRAALQSAARQSTAAPSAASPSPSDARTSSQHAVPPATAHPAPAAASAPTAAFPAQHPAKAPAPSAAWFDPDSPAQPDSIAEVRAATPATAWVRGDGDGPQEVPVTTPDGTTYPWRGPIACDIRDFTADGSPVRDFTVRLHLDTLAPDLEARACLGVEELFNRGNRLPGGEQFHVTVEFTDSPTSAHASVVVTGSGRPGQLTWPSGTGSRRLAHEVGHFLGLPDTAGTAPSAVGELRPADLWLVDHLTRATATATEPVKGGWGTGDEPQEQRLTPQRLRDEFGVPPVDQLRLQALAKNTSLSFDVPTANPDALAWLFQGAVVRPEGLGGRTVTDLDLHLGARPEMIGLLAHFAPAQPGELSGLDPATVERVRQRHSTRVEEHAAQEAEFADQIASGWVRLREGGVVEVATTEGFRPAVDLNDAFHLHLAGSADTLVVDDRELAALVPGRHQRGAYRVDDRGTATPVLPATVAQNPMLRFRPNAHPTLVPPGEELVVTAERLRAEGGELSLAVLELPLAPHRLATLLHEAHGMAVRFGGPGSAPAVPDVAHLALVLHDQGGTAAEAAARALATTAEDRDVPLVSTGLIGAVGGSGRPANSEDGNLAEVRPVSVAFPRGSAVPELGAEAAMEPIALRLAHSAVWRHANGLAPARITVTGYGNTMPGVFGNALETGQARADAVTNLLRLLVSRQLRRLVGTGSAAPLPEISAVSGGTDLSGAVHDEGAPELERRRRAVIAVAPAPVAPKESTESVDIRHAISATERRLVVARALLATGRRELALLDTTLRARVETLLVAGAGRHSADLSGPGAERVVLAERVSGLEHGLERENALLGVWRRLLEQARSGALGLPRGPSAAHRVLEWAQRVGAVRDALVDQDARGHRDQTVGQHLGRVADVLDGRPRLSPGGRLIPAASGVDRLTPPQRDAVALAAAVDSAAADMAAAWRDLPLKPVLARQVLRAGVPRLLEGDGSPAGKEVVRLAVALVSDDPLRAHLAGALDATTAATRVVAVAEQAGIAPVEAFDLLRLRCEAELLAEAWGEVYAGVLRPEAGARGGFALAADVDPGPRPERLRRLVHVVRDALGAGGENGLLALSPSSAEVLRELREALPTASSAQPRENGAPRRPSTDPDVVPFPGSPAAGALTPRQHLLLRSVRLRSEAGAEALRQEVLARLSPLCGNQFPEAVLERVEDWFATAPITVTLRARDVLAADAGGALRLRGARLPVPAEAGLRRVDRKSLEGLRETGFDLSGPQATAERARRQAAHLEQLLAGDHAFAFWTAPGGSVGPVGRYEWDAQCVDRRELGPLVGEVTGLVHPDHSHALRLRADPRRGEAHLLLKLEARRRAYFSHTGRGAPTSSPVELLHALLSEGGVGERHARAVLAAATGQRPEGSHDAVWQATAPVIAAHVCGGIDLSRDVERLALPASGLDKSTTTKLRSVAGAHGVPVVEYDPEGR